MKKSKKAIKSKSSTKKVKSKKNSDKIIKVNFDVIVRKSPLKYPKDPNNCDIQCIQSLKQDECNNKCRTKLYKSPIVEEIPKDIIKHIQKYKKDIMEHIFYDMFIICSINKKKCPYCECNNEFKMGKIIFDSNKKIISIKMIPPKQANYKDIKKSLMFEIKDSYGLISLSASGIDLYKIENNYYYIDWKFKNMVIPDYYKK